MAEIPRPTEWPPRIELPSAQIVNRYNPFQPNTIVTPGMFVGRLREVQTIARCLVQAKHRNPNHFLIMGERGIGKSSLLTYAEYAASGAIEATSDNKLRTRFVTTSVDLIGCNTQLDIMCAVARGIRKAVGEHQVAREKAKEFWNWLTNWEVLGVRYKKDNPNIEPQEVSEALIANVARFCANVHDDFDGLLILLDEADRSPADAGLGAFLKFFTERLARSDARNVLIGMAGLPSVLTKMRESHESSPRLFNTLLLEPLESGERKEVVQIGLEEATKRNGFEVKIADDALDLIAEMSEGYPNFVQEFAYWAFEHNSDNKISMFDVISGAQKENGAIAQLGQKYFNQMYNLGTSSDDYRRVLYTMAAHQDQWIARKHIISESGVKESTISNALTALTRREIIRSDESRKGFYRLPTKSFAAWIKAACRPTW